MHQNILLWNKKIQLYVVIQKSKILTINIFLMIVFLTTRNHIGKI